MKRYTGNLVIELEDQNTGVKEMVSETNMVTNAVNDILGVNPMGVMYKAGGQYDDSLTWNDALLPICPNMIGGILLFPGSITEQADNIYQPSTNLPVAYASNDVNATANTKRGSMNLTESMKLTDGYKFATARSLRLGLLPNRAEQMLMALKWQWTARCFRSRRSVWMMRMASSMICSGQ